MQRFESNNFLNLQRSIDKYNREYNQNLQLNIKDKQQELAAERRKQYRKTFIEKHGIEHIRDLNRVAQQKFLMKKASV